MHSSFYLFAYIYFNTIENLREKVNENNFNNRLNIDIKPTFPTYYAIYLLIKVITIV